MQQSCYASCFVLIYLVGIPKHSKVGWFLKLLQLWEKYRCYSCLKNVPQFLPWINNSFADFRSDIRDNFYQRCVLWKITRGPNDFLPSRTKPPLNRSSSIASSRFNRRNKRLYARYPTCSYQAPVFSESIMNSRVGFCPRASTGGRIMARAA